MSEPVEILLVEDNPDDVELALRAFARINLTNRIHVARDGEEALEFIYGEGRYEGRSLEEGPKIVLLDLKLPKVDGIEVVRRLKGDPRTKAIPLIVLTSSSEDPDVQACYGLGVNSYIVKPVDFEQFSESVAQLGMYWLLLNHPPKPRTEEG
jgi:two-component system, response regulator